MYGLTLGDADAQLIGLCSIDGKTGASGRHGSALRYGNLNRAYRELRARVSALGYSQFSELGSIAAIPARASGEDYIEIDRDDPIRQVAGVSVKGSLTSNAWGRLDRLDLSQWREGNTLRPPSGVGFWATIVAPKGNTTAIDPGKIAIWPHTLTGSYRLVFTSSWAALSTTTHVFPLEDGWETWLLARAGMFTVTRDTNKRDKYDDLRDMWAAADALLASSAPLDRSGSTEPTPYMGLEL